jgi:hypothetical protein
MKTIRKISVSLILGLLLTLSASMNAQDPLKAAPNVYKKVPFENDQVRVIAIEFAPGEVAAWHQHPAKTSLRWLLISKLVTPCICPP